MVSVRLAKTFISIISDNSTCDFTPMRCARSRTTTGGFIWITLLPLSSTIKAGWAGPTGTAAGLGAGASGGVGRGAVVILTVGCGRGAVAGFGGGVGFGGAAAGADLGGRTGGGGELRALVATFATGGLGASTIVLGGSTTTGGAGNVATAVAASVFSAS